MSPFSHSSVSIPNPNSLMSLSSTLRFSSSLLRRSLTHSRHFRFPLPDPICRLSRNEPSPARFFSSKTPTSSNVLGAAKPSNNGSVAVSGDDGNGGSRIVPFELHKEATESYMSYALSVLLGRALPDVRDGLKPVHRRILFAMHELGMSSKKPYKKSARVVGEVLGKFHPHGDTAVYDALVRMAQNFSLRSPLIQGHGNFGSIDADPAAAMRYTECRLDPLAEAVLLADLDQDTVDFVPNFDNSQKEPAVLPARLPALLLNGATGIAVGMATTIPPHNLGELVDVLCALIHNPEATLQELMEHMPAPDFPTGGVIMGNLGVLEAYRTGKGRVLVRGKAEIELLDPKTKRNAVIITEIPYQTNKATLVQKIAELVENKTLEGISDIRDESDRSGMRVVIELKRGGDPALVLNNLYRHTALQSSFNCNMVGISGGEPKLMGLKELLQEFIDFRCSVVERRARFKLSRAQQRKHIIEGIVIGLNNVDEVIKIIRKAPTDSSASAGLQSEFDLSEKQAEALLDISLKRLVSLEVKKYNDESNTLTEQIAKLEQLLSSRTNILKVIEKEAIELKDKFSNPRRSRVEDSDSGDLDDLDVIPNEEMLMAISEKGYVKRMKPNTFSLQQRGTRGKSVGKLRVNDAMADCLVCHAHDYVLFFSDRGIVYSTRAYKIPECSRSAAGTPLIHILSMSEGERVTSIIPVSEFAEDRYLLMLTVNGCIKKVPMKLFSGIRSTGRIAIQLNSGDELKWVRGCSSDDLVALASRNGQVSLRTCDDIRVTLSRNTKGVAAMKLKNEDKMASMDISPVQKDMDESSEDTSIDESEQQSTGPWLLIVCENGLGKRVPLSSFRPSRSKRVGVIGSKFADEDDRLAAVFVVGYSLAEDGESDEQVVLVSQDGAVNRIKVRDISIQSRLARGVKLMRLSGGKIQSASLISAVEDDEEEEADEIPSPEAASL